MKFKRSSGIILHPTSLPGPDGIGDLGPEAYEWIQFLVNSKCKLWQVLPLGPTGYGDSPYQCFSAFAGNPYLISPALLLEDGLITRKDLVDRPVFPDSAVNFGEVIQWKLTILDRAFQHFQKSSDHDLIEDMSRFQAQQAYWLDDFALFMAVKASQESQSWSTWPEPLRMRVPEVLEKFKLDHPAELQRQVFQQYLFFKQWKMLKAYANENNIQIIGDVPIFISHDSSDAWSNPELFYFDKHRQPTVVAGVPPDYFSPTGQLWGNPLYRWEIHKKTGYDWWIKRIKDALSMFDMIRLDHFRGFAGYWEVPAGMLTAEKGRWMPGPGADLFDAVQNALGTLPIIAEDLGEITPDVIALREKFALPGMKILQFAFASTPDDPFLPHNYPANCVAYSGTHDNDTTLGWYETAPEKERQFLRQYLERSGENVSWDLIRAVWSSVAAFSLAPMQDFLSLGSECRMNFPGKPSGNWSWRLLPGSANQSLVEKIKEINYLYSR
jgi:4-alpha-glucanotransferase